MVASKIARLDETTLGHTRAHECPLCLTSAPMTFDQRGARRMRTFLREHGPPKVQRAFFFAFTPSNRCRENQMENGPRRRSAPTHY